MSEFLVTFKILEFSSKKNYVYDLHILHINTSVNYQHVPTDNTHKRVHCFLLSLILNYNWKEELT